MNIPEGKKVILYVPTYREYWFNKKLENVFPIPLDLDLWEEKLGDEYVLLIRAHYFISSADGLYMNSFVQDVTNYPRLNDLYAISDLMISDYSSAFFDYAILDRPMLCFAFDMDEYQEKRGLYLDLAVVLPCTVDRDQYTLLEHILRLDKQAYIEKAKAFHNRFAPNADHACQIVVDEMERRINNL